MNKKFLVAKIANNCALDSISPKMLFLTDIFEKLKKTQCLKKTFFCKKKSKKFNLTVYLDMRFLNSGRDLALNVTLTCSQEGPCNENTNIQANLKNGFIIGFFRINYLQDVMQWTRC